MAIPRPSACCAASRPARSTARKFEPRFGALLGLSDHDRLTERLFAGLEPDEAMISGEVGLHKPQPEIYLLACERLGVGPGEATVAEIDRLRG